MPGPHQNKDEAFHAFGTKTSYYFEGIRILHWRAAKSFQMTSKPRVPWSHAGRAPSKVVNLIQMLLIHGASHVDKKHD